MILKGKGRENACVCPSELTGRAHHSDPEIANAMAPAINIILTVFNGVLINGPCVENGKAAMMPFSHRQKAPSSIHCSNRHYPLPPPPPYTVKDLPPGSGWLAQVGYNRWSFEAFALNEFRGRRFACPRPPGGDPMACILSGDQILNMYGYADGSITRAVAYLLCIALVTHVLAFLNLWRASTRYLAIEEANESDGGSDAGATTSVALPAPALPTPEEERAALEEVGAGGSGHAMAPVAAVDVAWREVEMVVPLKGKGTKAVLARVSGEVKSGTLTAIMGPSGA